MKKGYKVKCITVGTSDDETRYAHKLTTGKVYEVLDINQIGELRVLCDDGDAFSFSPHRFEVQVKRLELKDLFIGKTVVADYSTPVVAWVVGLTVSPIGEVVAVIKCSDDQREVPIHPNNLFELN